MTPTDKQELLPCPFCGEEAEVERLGTSRASMVVVCSFCGAKVECGAIRLSDSIWNDRQLPDQASAGEGWISVDSDIKPKLHQKVLIWTTDADDNYCCWHATYNGEKTGYLLTGGYKDKDLTHWQPLPNPPSDKTGDQD